KGAKGLLISITGGKDLTLYEVDEAATRIREEVDPDANIIVGATFDETLEGVIRVSVVATGIDNTGTLHKPAEKALKELAGRVRAESARTADRIERERRPATAAATAPPANPDSAASAAHAAVAAALLPPAGAEEVSIRPMPMKPSLLDPPAAEAPAEAPPPEAFIPPPPERTATQAPRMPRIDELPLPA